MKRGMRNGRIHRLLGDRIFHPHIWSFDERSLSGGLALGLFIAFTPTLTFQMRKGSTSGPAASFSPSCRPFSATC
jgi:hypothetical protein